MSTMAASEVGSYFISQYYKVLCQNPEECHRFYGISSTITRINGNDSQTVFNKMNIHFLLTSLGVTKVDVTNLNVQFSLNGSLLLSVFGVMSRNFYGQGKFTQTFFLAPQGSGFFVMNDILHFHDEEVANQEPVRELPDLTVDSQVPAHISHLEQPVSNHELKDETTAYVNSLHIEDDTPTNEETYEEPHHETVVEEAPVEQYSFAESIVNHVEDAVPTPALAYEEPHHEAMIEEALVEQYSFAESIVNQVEDTVLTPALAPQRADEPGTEQSEERPKLSYASILKASEGQSSQLPVSRQPAVRRSMPPPASLAHTIPSATPSVSEATVVGPTVNVVKEVDPKSVYVKNLPSNVTDAVVKNEFKNFGKIKANGVFIKYKPEIGACFAFVEFEDTSSVQNAIEASPVEILGNRVYIEERKASSTNSTRGGAVSRGRGRGAGSYQNGTSSTGRNGSRNPGRGSTY